MGIWASGLTMLAVTVLSTCGGQPPLQMLSGDVVTGGIGPCLTDCDWLRVTDTSKWLHSLRHDRQIDNDLWMLSAQLWHRFRYDSLRALLLIVDLPSERASQAVDALLNYPVFGNGTFPAENVITAKYMSCVIGHQPALRAIQRYIDASVEPGTFPSIGAIEDWPTKVSVYRGQLTQDDLSHLDNLCLAVETDSVDSLNGVLHALHVDPRLFLRLPFMYALKEDTVRRFLVDVFGINRRSGTLVLVKAWSDAGLPPQCSRPVLDLLNRPQRQQKRTAKTAFRKAPGADAYSAVLAPQLRELVVESAPPSSISLPFLLQNQVLETEYDECFRNASHEWRLFWLDMACREGRARLVEFMLGHRYWADVAPSDDLITFAAHGWELYSLTDPDEGPVGKKWRPIVRYDDVIQDGDPVLTCFRLIVQHRLRLLQGQQDRVKFRDFMSVLSTDPNLHPKTRRIAGEAVQSLSS
ncbi:Uncharacterized protein PBTT_08172 [Plasmodiophora brassicae]|uniref:Uncharacterized protein n=1 Tax=Plasmodiophora brassicae TaxID=37360 RepID=A0A3P3YJL4_PLABS|nr:unnamed protein product [Plasmodiophora brassicae]